MFINDLYNTVLINPAKKLSGIKNLYIVSGYSSASFTRRHLEDLDDENISVNVIIGMNSKKADHLAYLDLIKKYPGQFNGYYLDTKNHHQVHSKVYAWSNGRNDFSFSGSANYSESAFMKTQINQMSLDKYTDIVDFYESLLDKSIKIEDYTPAEPISTLIEGLPANDVPPGGWEFFNNGNSAKISFLQKNGEISKKSGLNWGQRDGREPNQAYLPLRKDTRSDNFLPQIGFRFSLVTDDQISFDCVKAQDGGKGIHSTDNNSLLGIYFRKRLGLGSGDFVKKEDLVNYGRTDYTIHKIQEDSSDSDPTFILDFSVS